ncbi:glycosyltransferase [Dinoroseobacter sp. S375]|uniref:glycosyltransferase n=1 Tax=Dinoroseobacter sp. S375 TaxID=3415136 RepID=UPI003C7A9B51
MRDFPLDAAQMPVPVAQPIGFFVHHQGRGHATRTCRIIEALPAERPVTVFCADAGLMSDVAGRARVIEIPSLFERSGREAAGCAELPAPRTVHCAPVGWPGIRDAMGAMAGWFARANPALFVVDVSAEVAQLARLCSVPHVKILQHGLRADPGHRAAYDGAAGLLAPFHKALAQPDWPHDMLRKIHFAPGLGCDGPAPDRAAARRRLGLPARGRIVLALSGAGGHGLSEAPLSVGARATPDHQWITIGTVTRDWHATVPGNLHHLGWVPDAADYIAAADLVISSAGNTVCAQVLAARRPWLVVPEWCYFDEQIEKARALARIGAAHTRAHLPGSEDGWRSTLEITCQIHDPARQASLDHPEAAIDTAHWLENLCARLWGGATRAPVPTPATAHSPSPATTMDADQ